MVPGSGDEMLPDIPEVNEQYERRRRFDEDWNGISEVLASIPLEPLVVNIATKPDDDESAELLPRTSNELAEEVLEILNSMFHFLSCLGGLVHMIGHWTLEQISVEVWSQSVSNIIASTTKRNV